MSVRFVHETSFVNSHTHAAKTASGFIEDQIASTMKFTIAAFVSCLGFASGFVPSVKPTFTSKLFGEYGASSTSFYTTTEKKTSYKSLEDVLAAKCKDVQLREVITDMLGACAEITEALRTALVTVEGSMNDFGDAQLSVDVS